MRDGHDGYDGVFRIPPVTVTVMRMYVKSAVLPYGRTPHKRKMQTWDLPALVGV